MLNSLYIGNRDGGIINTITQAPQTGAPFVIIGLGGTGVDAVSHLKTKLKHQIIPDNAARVKEEGEEPKYEHIKFLGIDADSDWLKKSGLNDAECLNIQNYNYRSEFAAPKLPSLKVQRELQWMSTDYVADHLPPHPDGAGAYRQFGRWLTVSKAGEIKSKIHQVVIAATRGVTGNALTVHIISGISGGMGAGSFVDVCYITRSVLEDLGLQAANIFGYFVLPDAICSKPSITGDPVKMQANQRNGMASLLEIEHLMNLKDSNEWFEQDYGNGFCIKTQSKLVDMCHLVSATNTQGVLISNAYEYALNVIGDYILAFVSKENLADGATGISMTGHLANITAQLAGINPANDRGYSQNYHLLGAANGEIPTAQMATYLASELFKKLTISKNMPTNLQIEQEFAGYLNLTDNKVSLLAKNVERGASWTPVDKKTVEKYFDQIKANRNNNVIPLPVVEKTEDSLSSRKGVLDQNRKSAEKEIDATYLWQNNATSVPGLAFNKLIEMIEDPAKGPIYAYGMMNKTGDDIFAYLDGRRLTYSKLKTDALNQVTLFSGKEPEAKRALADANFLNKSARIEEYTKALNNTYHWQAKADLYEEMETLLANLITSFHNINDKYLKPLYHITNELIETFDANSTYFSMGKGDQSQDGFTKQLVIFSHIKPVLDAAIGKLNSAKETTGLLKILTGAPKVWMEHQETKLKAEISKYILEKFDPILSQSLETFLRKDLDKENATAEQFADAIHDQIIIPFVDDAAPIFWTNQSMVQSRQETAHRSILTVPNVANCIRQAAANYKGVNGNIDIRKSLINDRIYVLRTISGVPMYAYLGLTTYLPAYDTYQEEGIHSYEKGNENWREILTFPYPYSYVPGYTKNAEELLALYKDAEDKGIIYYAGSRAYVKRLQDIPEAVFDFDSLEDQGKIDQMKANAKTQELQTLLTQTQEPLEINSRGNSSTNDPDNSDLADHANTLVKDNFLRFYGIQQAVKAEVKKYDRIQQALDEVQKKLAQANVKTQLREVVFDAILSDVFTDKDGFTVSYDYVEFGMQQQEVLCANGMPFAGLSKYYQVFKSVQDLDAAIQNQLTSETGAKFNAMTAQAKWDKIGKLMGIYTPALVGMIVNNFAGNLEQSEVKQFYQEFNNYLTQRKMQLAMMGFTSNTNND